MGGLQSIQCYAECVLNAEFVLGSHELWSIVGQVVRIE